MTHAVAELPIDFDWDNVESLSSEARAMMLIERLWHTTVVLHLECIALRARLDLLTSRPFLEPIEPAIAVIRPAVETSTIFGPIAVPPPTPKGRTVSTGGVMANRKNFKRKPCGAGCGNEFAPTTSNAKYCPDCKSRMHLREPVGFKPKKCGAYECKNIFTPKNSGREKYCDDCRARLRMNKL